MLEKKGSTLISELQTRHKYLCLQLMKSFIYMLSLFVVINCFGQTETNGSAFNKTLLVNNNSTKDNLIKLLKKGDLLLFNEYLRTKVSNCGQRVNWNYYREIIPQYFEAELKFANCHEMQPGMYADYDNTEIKVIIHDSYILYWRLDYYSDSTKNQVDSGSINKEFKDLETGFFNEYKMHLNKMELFEDDMQFGKSCGYANSEPEEWKEIKTMVNQKNIASLQKWLRCANIYKEVYAIAGFMELKKQHYIIDNETYEIIKYIGKKKGEINTCEGCIGDISNISELVKQLMK